MSGSVFRYSKAFSGFSVNDLQKAKEFYSKTLSFDVSEMNGFLNLHIGNDAKVQSYCITIHIYMLINIDDLVLPLFINPNEKIIHILRIN